MDLQHWALVRQHVHTIESTSDSDSVALQLVRKILKHYPVVFEFMKVAPHLQVNIFQRSFQLVENFTIDQETHGLTGFDILKTWDSARSLSKTHYDTDSADGVDNLMGAVTSAEASEYKIKSNSKRRQKVFSQRRMTNRPECCMLMIQSLRPTLCGFLIQRRRTSSVDALD